METRTIRRTSVTLPELDRPDLYLSHVTSLEGGRGRLEEFHYAGGDLRDLDLADTHLLDGRVTGLKARRVQLEKIRVDAVEFAGCDLSSLRWADSRVSRTVFRDCRLMGAALEGVTLDHVLFESCKIDYGTFTRVRAVGPVIFVNCSLREVTFTAADLGAALIDDCDLRLTAFEGGKYRGLDLRGNDLSQVRGLSSLRGIVIDHSQASQLTEALTAELDITFGEDLSNG
ncbi:pentapeptide repeat-containing protein [Streptomyces sp. NPDC059853]|uniref:pentapeptide repeat-containing protein n=1 Tax=Streptomyces sp. NPDC059853 TaxID=3346973 RepID=UPI0036500CDA